VHDWSYNEAHSVFPIECVAGIVEITMNLDADKLKDDMTASPQSGLCEDVGTLCQVPNTTTKGFRLEQENLAPRSSIIGLPADAAWKPATIAKALRDRQPELGYLHTFMASMCSALGTSRP